MADHEEVAAGARRRSDTSLDLSGCQGRMSVPRSLTPVCQCVRRRGLLRAGLPITTPPSTSAQGPGHPNPPWLTVHTIWPTVLARTWAERVLPVVTQNSPFGHLLHGVRPGMGEIPTSLPKRRRSPLCVDSGAVPPLATAHLSSPLCP